MRLVADLDDDVALFEAGEARRGLSAFDRVDERSSRDRAAVGEGLSVVADRDTEERVIDVAGFDDLIRDALHHLDGDRIADALGAGVRHSDGGGDPDELALGVDERATR